MADKIQLQGSILNSLSTQARQKTVIPDSGNSMPQTIISQELPDRQNNPLQQKADMNRLMSALSFIANKIEQGFNQTVNVLTTMNNAITSRLETVTRQLQILNATIKTLNETQFQYLNRQKKSTDYIRFFELFNSKFANYLIMLRKQFITGDDPKLVTMAVLRLVAKDSFLSRVFGRRSFEAERRQHTAYFTFELYQTILKLPTILRDITQQLVNFLTLHFKRQREHFECMETTNRWTAESVNRLVVLEENRQRIGDKDPRNLQHIEKRVLAKRDVLTATIEKHHKKLVERYEQTKEHDKKTEQYQIKTTNLFEDLLKVTMTTSLAVTTIVGKVLLNPRGLFFMLAKAFVGVKVFSMAVRAILGTGASVLNTLGLLDFAKGLKDIVGRSIIGLSEMIGSALQLVIPKTIYDGITGVFKSILSFVQNTATMLFHPNENERDKSRTIFLGQLEGVLTKIFRQFVWPITRGVTQIIALVMAGKWIMGHNARQATKYVDADGKSTLAPTAKGRLLAGQPLVQPLTMNKIWGVGSEEDKQRRFSIMGAARRHVLPELMGGQKPWMQGIGLEQRGSYDAKLRTPGYSTDMAHVHNLAERGVRKVLTKQVSLAAPPPGATPAQMIKWRSMQSSMGKLAMKEEIKLKERLNLLNRQDRLTEETKVKLITKSRQELREKLRLMRETNRENVIAAKAQSKLQQFGTWGKGKIQDIKTGVTDTYRRDGALGVVGAAGYKAINIAAYLPNIMKSVFGTVMNVLGSVARVFGTVTFIYSILSMVTSAIGNMFTKWSSKKENEGKGVGEFVTSLFDWLTSFIITGFTNIVTKGPGFILKILGGIAVGIYKMFASLFSWLGASIRVAWYSMLDWVADYSKELQEARDALNGITSSARDVIDANKEKEAAEKEAAEAAENEKSETQSIIERIEQWTKSFTDYFTGGAFSDDMLNTARTIGKALKGIAEVLSGVWDVTVEGGSKLLGGLANTTGAFMSGLFGEAGALDIFTTAAAYAEDKGWTDIAGLLNQAKDKGVLGGLKDAASKTDVAGTRMLEGATTFKEYAERLLDQDTVKTTSAKELEDARRLKGGEHTNPHGLNQYTFENKQKVMGLGEGKVVFVDNSSGEGTRLGIHYPAHDAVFFYSQLEKVDLKVGDTIKKAQLLGESKDKTYGFNIYDLNKVETPNSNFSKAETFSHYLQTPGMYSNQLQAASVNSVQQWMTDKNIIQPAEAGNKLPISSSLLTWGLPKVYKLNSDFGMRKLSYEKEPRMHRGIDLNTQIGTPITSLGDGDILLTHYLHGYGNTLDVYYPSLGHTLRYAHLSKFNVKAGQKVKEGDLLALTGNTGIGTGAHVHIETAPGRKIIQRGDQQSPIPWQKSMLSRSAEPEQPKADGVGGGYDYSYTSKGLINGSNYNSKYYVERMTNLPVVASINALDDGSQSTNIIGQVVGQMVVGNTTAVNAPSTSTTILGGEGDPFAKNIFEKSLGMAGGWV
jgi:murein DD-endopeptidase MepM/ murein hydrolase activator NlpD